MSKDNKLAHKRLLEVLSYDLYSGSFTWNKTLSNRCVFGSNAGCSKKYRCGKSYSVIGIDGEKYFAHRLAWFYVTGHFPEFEVDHIDGNGLNNKFENLRSVCRVENCRNIRKQKNNTSGHTGVSWLKRAKKWRSVIYVNRKHILIGLFENINDAIAARKVEERKYGFHVNHGSEREL